MWRAFPAPWRSRHRIAMTPAHASPALNRSECVIDTLEGPGIVKSECPTCRAPVWKKELRRAHAFENLIAALRELESQLAAQPAGTLCSLLVALVPLI